MSTQPADPTALPDSIDRPDEPNARNGFFYALGAYGLWGLFPLFLKLVEHVHPAEVVAHRVLWSIPIAGILIILLRRTADLKRAFASPRILAMMALTAALVSVNWGVFVWTIQLNIASQGALGYYINPLLSVMLGAILLGEKLKRLQWAAIGLAALAVLLLAVAGGRFPWIALVLATTFALYGFFRKTVNIGPTQGFFLETIILAPVALGYLLWVGNSQGIGGNGLAFASSTSNTLLLLCCGPATAIPLILYAFAAKNMRLSTLGLMQYIAPTGIFLIAFLVFDEPPEFWTMTAFVLIWSALALYSWSAFSGAGE
ncbi:MAG: EamA family transporter RarD [Pseudomonadota bacterium]